MGSTHGWVKIRTVKDSNRSHKEQNTIQLNHLVTSSSRRMSARESIALNIRTFIFQPPLRADLNRWRQEKSSEKYIDEFAVAFRTTILFIYQRAEVWGDVKGERRDGPAVTWVSWAFLQWKIFPLEPSARLLSPLLLLSCPCPVSQQNVGVEYEITGIDQIFIQSGCAFKRGRYRDMKRGKTRWVRSRCAETHNFAPQGMCLIVKIGALL